VVHRKVAIVGAGPAGIFTAEALIERNAAAEIDIVEQLPVPFGLVRFGVAPDHPQTKRVIDTYNSTLAHPSVRYFGNVRVDRDVSLAELRENYDAVVIAIGAQSDIAFTVPGADLPGVCGAAEFVGWYNGHPDFQEFQPPLNCTAIAIIGLGNVALDIARMLVTPPHKLMTTDLTHSALTALLRSSVRDVFIIGRRGPLDARFTGPELRELQMLDGVSPFVTMSQLPPLETTSLTKTQARNLKTFWDFARMEKRQSCKSVNFVFDSPPTRVLGSSKVTGLRIMRSAPHGSPSEIDIPCGGVISAIGFRSQGLSGLELDGQRGLVPNNNGRVADGLFVAGWVRRGPTGVIGTSKPDGVSVAEAILADCTAGERAGRSALQRILDARGCTIVDAAGWHRIDAAERARARAQSPREKFTAVEEMLSAATTERAS
jgi:ferredoxin--NADP+ reductase